MLIFDLDTLSAGLPAAAVLPALGELAAAGPVRAVVEAPPGTGKTTLVPPALANAAGKGADSAPPRRVIVAQPRRMAARSAARRLASLSGTRLGEEVGYAVRGDRKSGPRTRVEFVTHGLLVRRLLSDPELAGASAVVLDEVHERHLDSDLAFGMLRELVELREDLGLVVMSATLDARMWAQLLGEQEPAPVLSVAAVTHDLEVRWAPPAQRPLDARAVTPQFLDHVAAQTVRATAEPDSGDVLVFLPGMREVDRVAGAVRTKLDSGQTGSGSGRPDSGRPASGLPGGVEVLTLTGSTPAREQDRILGAGRAAVPGTRAQPARRVIVATAVAESSLTVPGVRTVVDSGLSRQPRLDTVRGMSGLVTVRESKAAGTQRAGRAAREAPGRVIRCLAESDWAALPAETPPEVTTADLTSAMLDLACWGAPRGAGLALPTPLPVRASELAADTLHGIGALDQTGRATELGLMLARIPADPRLGRALLLGALVLGARSAGEVVAALAADQRAPHGDLGALLTSLRSSRDRTWAAEADRFTRLAEDTLRSGSSSGGGGLQAAPGAEGFRNAAPQGFRTSETVGAVTALARPDQIARRRPDAADHYLLASGTGAQLPRGSALAGQEWLAVAEVGLSGGNAVIRAAAPISREVAEFAAQPLRSEHEDAWFEDGRVRARRVERLGAIELSSTPAKPTKSARETATAAAIAQSGPRDVLRPDAGFEELRRRLGFIHATVGPPWPDVRWGALLERFSGRLSEGASESWLQELLPWPEAARLAELAPPAMPVPSGRRIRVDYPEPEEHVQAGGGSEARIAPPVLAVKLQECFGMAEGPRICGVPVVMHLLSPAGRPLAVTSDLASFWNGAYADVRAENRRRYAKHPWPEDPWNAPPARGTKKQGR
ncbi:ATP-dependent helicase HrpB [Brevibacterium daeguense]|uniref:ATP-dependent helicase HrpB n=1 Tax=Brevibacterium daeguense TaxID=909936 RepID=A0ABP8ELM5_9MICO|nr:ATP-dependent helicase C-terminal domain-containing protein [Brevibacterium daeguense]